MYAIFRMENEIGTRGMGGASVSIMDDKESKDNCNLNIQPEHSTWNCNLKIQPEL